MSREKIGKVQGGKTKRSFPVYWDPETKRIWIEIPGGFFSGPMLRDTENIASSAGMAMHAAEAFCYDK